MRRPNPGILTMLPVLVFLLAGFVIPILVVALYSLMPPRTFELTGSPTFTNYATAFAEGYWRPLMWSALGAAATTLICLALAWPTARALDRFAGRWATLVTLLIALPIFISESVRLFGLALFMMPGGGILAGSIDALFGVSIGTILYTRLAALLGLVYIHFPFVLFPLLLGVSLIPKDPGRSRTRPGRVRLAGIPGDRSAAGGARRRRRRLAVLRPVPRGERGNEHPGGTGRNGDRQRDRATLQLRPGLAAGRDAHGADGPAYRRGRVSRTAAHRRGQPGRDDERTREIPRSAHCRQPGSCWCSRSFTYR